SFERNLKQPETKHLSFFIIIQLFKTFGSKKKTPIWFIVIERPVTVYIIHIVLFKLANQFMIKVVKYVTRYLSLKTLAKHSVCTIAMRALQYTVNVFFSIHKLVLSTCGQMKEIVIQYLHKQVGRNKVGFTITPVLPLVEFIAQLCKLRYACQINVNLYLP